MSFTINPAAANGSNGMLRSMLDRKSLKGMAVALGVTASAIVITAGHQIAAEEGRHLLRRMRDQRSSRRDRNNAVLCALLAADNIDLDLIRHLEMQRDVFRAAIRITVDPEVPEEKRVALRTALRELYEAAQTREK